MLLRRLQKSTKQSLTYELLSKFLQEVRAEAQKVTWPTRKETTVTTMMVFVMVFVASIFFLLADQVMRVGIGFLLGINS